MMGASTAIAWTEASWNPVSGCTKVSPACAYCYAERLTKRWHPDMLPWIPRYADVAVKTHRNRLGVPSGWKRPRTIFLCSMGDLFHDAVSDVFIEDVFAQMALNQQHHFLVLTKRAERMRRWFQETGDLEDRAMAVARSAAHQGNIVWDARGNESWRYDRATPEKVANRRAFPGWPLPNVALGVSSENQLWFARRTAELLATPAARRFVSIEPLLGPIGPTDLHGIDWVIVGGESGGSPERRLVERCTTPEHDGMDCPRCRGTGFRPVQEKLKWVRYLRDVCRATGTPFFFKQWGGPTPNGGGFVLDGQTWRQTIQWV